MKTLHITNAWHASSGGIGTFYKALFETANRQAHSLRLVVPGETTSVEEVGEFVRIYNIEAPLAPLNGSYRVLYPYRFLLPGTAIQRILNYEKPDLVEISGKYTLPYLAGLLRTGRLPGVQGRPVVAGSSHERMGENLSTYLSRGPAGQAFCRWYMKWVYFPMFDHHITVSEHTAEELVQASRGHKIRRGIRVCPMGVDCATFTLAKRTEQGRRELLERVGGNAGTTVLLYAGRLAPEKNVALLLEVMDRLRRHNCKLAIAGTGIQASELAQQCVSRNLENVHFLGHVGGRDELAGLFANADVFVHPNPREPFGIAPLEAMAAGLAVVAPNCGGVTSYANGRNAWLAAATAAEFSVAIRDIQRNPRVRVARARVARETAESYGWPEITARYSGALRRDCAGNEGRTPVTGDGSPVVLDARRRIRVGDRRDVIS